MLPKLRHAVAALPDYNPRSVQAWLSGTRNPPVGFLVELCRAFPDRDPVAMLAAIEAKRPS